jgi:hypothetical protein
MVLQLSPAVSGSYNQREALAGAPTKITAYLIEKKAPSLWVMPVPIFVLRCGAPGAMAYSYLKVTTGSTRVACRAGT